MHAAQVTLKERLLGQSRSQHVGAVADRDTLRIELGKLGALFRSKQTSVDEQVRVCVLLLSRTASGVPGFYLFSGSAVALAHAGETVVRTVSRPWPSKGAQLMLYLGPSMWGAVRLQAYERGKQVRTLCLLRTDSSDRTHADDLG